jgi:hypothetical protein
VKKEMMKSMRKIAAMILLFGISAVGTAIAGNPKSVVVTNNTTYTLVDFYASSSDSSAWDTTNNLLAGQTLAPGQQTTITISDSGGGGDEECNYDLMAVLNGAAQAAYTYSVNTCGGGSWSINGM